MNDSSSNDSEPDHTWEYVKENVRPVRTGRSVKDIAALTAVPTTSEMSSTADKKEGTISAKDIAIRKYLQLIDSQVNSGGDPLAVWIRYIAFMERTNPAGNGKRLILPLVERCTDSLLGWRNAQGVGYQDDARMLDVFLKRIAMDRLRDLEMFQFLEGRRMFSEITKFYRAWAFAAERRHHYRQAAETYELGIARKAQPIALLVQYQQHFRQRLVETDRLHLAYALEAGTAATYTGPPVVLQSVASEARVNGAPSAGLGGRVTDQPNARAASFSVFDPSAATATTAQ